MKEEERIERIIRGLLKQPENRRCINCNSLGPQYACTTFWTFICTNCSGIHREFTHRVKSVSMAMFTADEASSLQTGGNERARQTFFKTWDPSKNVCPDGSNLNKLREFIRTVYVDRRFSGDRIQDNRPSSVKLGSKDVYDDRLSSERSTPTAREAFVERHSFESSSLGDRLSYEKFSRGGREDLRGRLSVEKYATPRKNNERSLRYCVDQIRSPVPPVRQKSCSARFEIVDDRFREDRAGNVKKYEHYKFSRTESKQGSRSPDGRRVRSEQSPVASPVRAISGDKAPELKVGEYPTTPKPMAQNETTDGSAKAEKTGVSKDSSGSSPNAKPSQNEVVQQLPVSLIDFDTEPQSLSVTSTTQPETSGTTSSNDKVSPVDTLEALLFGLSPSVSATENKALVPFVNDANPGTTPPPARDAGQTEILALPGPEDFEAHVQNVQHSMQNPPSAYPSGINTFTPQQSTELTLYNPHSTSEPSPNFGEAAFSNMPQQSSQPAWDASSGNDLRSSGRRELPAELFTSSYAPFSAAPSPWQFHPPHGMGYGMQYNPHPTMMVSTKSRNPFDDESPQFPSMSPSPPFPYSLPSPQLASSYGMAMPLGAYVGQQLNDNMLIHRHQRSHSDETGESAFVSLNPLQQSSSGSTYQMPSASNPHLSRGNPFT
ncbi:PREDICTED: probable ADP-ribosylation factor GTPase-activating protein AGD14 isoform X2 [Ipomoea nil]|uniref:probable ADP-ribosylation factor GTPase-activating protein AGD14 isoform X2 n=1 Tax=Ipomoea nil TaxID=35883 RepID=UPI0009012FC0|nr:PREDICTED: probable ADP-ribosylation factor GTPase-activating protein AGD14 isoform X2 [Ipomoea nil]